MFPNTMSMTRTAIMTKFTEDIDGSLTIRPTTTDSEETLVENNDVDHGLQLAWRSWVVVLVTCFAQMAQVFVVAGSGQVIGFIARDLGDADLAAWIIQAPLLMQSALSPIVGRLSDVLDRRWLVSIPPFIAFIGAIVSATANSMSTLIGGGVLIGVTLSTLSIVQSISSEVLPLKYRAVSNGAGFLGSAIGGVAGILGGGAVTNTGIEGWRYIFWTQAALHGATCIGFVLLYHPPKRTQPCSSNLLQLVWMIDPIGSGFFVIGTTLTLLALTWVDTYGWSAVQVVASLSIGLFVLVLFALYEWKGRDDGLLAHALFMNSPNFSLAHLALACEGFLFYSIVNTAIPQMTLDLGFEDDAWSIAVRQLSCSLTTIGACIPVVWYATKYKDLKNPILATFGVFLIATLCYSLITPEMTSAQIGYNILVSIGQSGPLILLVAMIQLVSPHKYLSTATGLAFSVRAIGGAFGLAIVNLVTNSKLNSIYVDRVGQAAVDAGLPESSVQGFVNAMRASDVKLLKNLPGSNAAIVAAATTASQWAYAYAYRLAWSSTIPFIVIAMVTVFFTKGVQDLMTDKVEASIEPALKSSDGKEAA